MSKGRRYRNREELIIVQRLIVKWKSEGWSQVKIAQSIDMTQSQVSRILKQYRELGQDRVPAELDRRGAQSKLDAHQLALLSNYLNQPASLFGFADDLWNCPRIAVFIESQFGVKYSTSHLSRLMKRIGFSLPRSSR